MTAADLRVTGSLGCRGGGTGPGDEVVPRDHRARSVVRRSRGRTDPLGHRTLEPKSRSSFAWLLPLRGGSVGNSALTTWMMAERTTPPKLIHNDVSQVGVVEVSVGGRVGAPCGESLRLRRPTRDSGLRQRFGNTLVPLGLGGRLAGHAAAVRVSSVIGTAVGNREGERVVQRRAVVFKAAAYVDVLLPQSRSVGEATDDLGRPPPPF